MKACRSVAHPATCRGLVGRRHCVARGDLQAQRMPIGGTDDLARRDPMIERDQASVVHDGERQQAEVRDLVVSRDPRPVHHARCAQRDIVRPERVVDGRTDFGDFLRDDFEADRPELAVAGQIEDADNPILDERARRGLDATTFDERQRLPVENVCLVEQRHPDVDVQEMAQLDPFLVHQMADVIGCDRLVAGRQQGEAGLRLGQRRVGPTLRHDALPGETRHDLAERQVFVPRLRARTGDDVVVEGKRGSHRLARASTLRFRINASKVSARHGTNPIRADALVDAVKKPPVRPVLPP